ncbi:MAG: hypothetical protein ACK5L7_09100 [Paludibacteraceae bacterium]
MNDKLTILKFYQTIVEAEVDMDVLQKNNIDCTLDTDDTIVIYPFFDDKEKGIKLYVFEQDADNAKRLLEAFHAETDFTGNEEEL